MTAPPPIVSILLAKPTKYSMLPQNRRCFVKRSLASSAALTAPAFFTGLIRAHGEGGETTTTDPWETTAPETTGPGDTTIGTTYDPFETTVETTAETTTESPGTTQPPGTNAPPKKVRWKCKRTISGASDQPFTSDQLRSMDEAYVLAHNPWGSPPQGPPQGGLYVSGPETLEWWPPGEKPLYTVHMYRDPETPSLQNWRDPQTGKYYAAYLYDFIMEDIELTEPPGP